MVGRKGGRERGRKEVRERERKEGRKEGRKNKRGFLPSLTYVIVGMSSESCHPSLGQDEEGHLLFFFQCYS